MHICDIALTDYRVLDRGDEVIVVMFVQGQFRGCLLYTSDAADE